MSGNVVSLSEYRPHSSGEARCLACRHEWAAVAPLGTEWLECPACSLIKGRYIYSHLREGSVFVCGCGCDLFQLSSEGAYCPNCGVWAKGWEEG